MKTSEGSNSAQMVKRLLVIDDEPAICDFVLQVARGQGFDVATASHHGEFKRLCGDFKPMVVVMDLAMPDIDGVELLRFLAKENSTAEVILMSGFDKKVLNSAKRMGHEHGLKMKGVLEKPIAIEKLEALLAMQSEFSESVTEQELVAAIDNGELVAHYQPKAALPVTSRSTSTEVEALVRWQNPVNGLLTPNKFLGAVEKFDLFLPMTHAVVAGVCRQMREWDRLNIPVSVAVNVAPQLLTNLSLPDEIAALAEQHGIDTMRLIIEITETGVMEDTARAADILTRFRIKGFRLSLDDFGTGFSSLIQLYRMPFMELKIDQSFVRDVGANEEARVIVYAMTEMAHRLGLTVCAEGVETIGDLRFLSTAGCDKAQGYFISPPVPGEKITDFVLGGTNGRELRRERA